MTHHLAILCMLFIGWTSLHQPHAFAQDTPLQTPADTNAPDATPPDVKPQSPADGPVDEAAAEKAALTKLVRDYAEAYYLSDGEKLAAMSAGELDADALSPNFEPPTDDERQWIERNLKSLSIQDIAPKGFAELPQAKNHRQLLVVMDAGILPIDLVKVEDQWKVDPRWWLGLHAQDDARTYLAREFVRYAVGGNAGRIAQFAAPHPDLYALSLSSGHSPSQLAMLADMTDQMPIIKLREGDIYNTPGQPAKVVAADDINENTQLFMAFFNQNKLPIRLVKTDDAWKVDASSWIELVTSNTTEANVEKLAEAKRTYDQRLATSRLINAVDAGSSDEVKALLDNDPPQQALDKGLAAAVEGYWVANQHGQLEADAPWLGMIDQLLAAGANVNVNVNVHGLYTPLMVAVHFGNGSNIDLVNLLLKHDADVNHKNTEGKTAFDLINNLAYTQPLLDAGAKPGDAINDKHAAERDRKSVDQPTKHEAAKQPASPGSD